MRTRTVGVVSSAAIVLLTAGCATQHGASRLTTMTTTTGEAAPSYQATVKQVVGAWDPTTRELARQLIAKYGLPDEATPARMLWHRRAPWTRIEITDAPLPHRFPAPHLDVLTQAIDLSVPAEQANQLLAYNGSVLIDRTRGELAARSDSEASNILMLNLAHEILSGTRTPEDARTLHAQAVQQGQHDPYKQRLRFPVGVNTADPDRELVPMPSVPGVVGSTAPAGPSLTGSPPPADAAAPISGPIGGGPSAPPATGLPQRAPVLGPPMPGLGPTAGADGTSRVGRAAGTSEPDRRL